MLSAEPTDFGLRAVILVPNECFNLMEIVKTHNLLLAHLIRDGKNMSNIVTLGVRRLLPRNGIYIATKKRSGLICL